jgi:uncharacterized FlaG/YvyC family protein
MHVTGVPNEIPPEEVQDLMDMITHTPVDLVGMLVER